MYFRGLNTRRFYHLLLLVECCHEVWWLLCKCLLWLVAVIFCSSFLIYLVHHKWPLRGLVCDLRIQLKLFSIRVKICMVVERYWWRECWRWQLACNILNWIYIYLVFKVELALRLFDVLIFLCIKRYVLSWLVLIEIFRYFVILVHFRGGVLRGHSSKVQLPPSVLDPWGIWDLAHSGHPLLVISLDLLSLLWLLFILFRRECRGRHFLIRLSHIWRECGFVMPICFWFHLDKLSILVMNEVYVDALVDVVLVYVRALMVRLCHFYEFAALASSHFGRLHSRMGIVVNCLLLSLIDRNFFERWQPRIFDLRMCFLT
jgi:hypothetical protein